MKKQAELIIVYPEGEGKEAIAEFVGKCIIYGLDFYAEGGDRLPNYVPEGIDDVRGIAIDKWDLEKNAKAIATYERNGAQVYILEAAVTPIVPCFSWRSEHVMQHMVFNSNLTVNSPRYRERMCSRSDDFVFNCLGERMLETDDERWYDSTRYNWEGLVDGYEVTGDRRYLDLVCSQINAAMEREENDLLNCDRVSPFIPMLRVYEHTGDDRMLHYIRGKFDKYIEITPRYRGCLVNFAPHTRNARAEIVLQVCPGLMRFANITGDSKYSELALDQFDKLNSLLYSDEMGLWYHGICDGGRSAGFWARGVAFSFLGIMQVLEETGKNDSRYELMRSIYQKMAAAIRGLQDKSGFWFGLVDHPGTEFESSGTAWVGAAMERGIRLGYLDNSYRECADLAWEAVKSRVWRGHYPGHTMATACSKVYDYYLKRPLNPNGWTHFAFRIACERRRTAKEVANV